MIAIAYHVTLEETEVGKAAFGSVLVPRQASMQTLFVHCTMLDEIITLIVPWTAGSEMVKTEVQLSQECLGYSK
ncbi:unnamed protein product [Cladocopium goreaui]|nr:unnamed protein product [Cladocopium goreaui]